MAKNLFNIITLISLTIVLAILVTDTSSELMRRAQHVNKAGLKLIKKFEGFRSRFYVDQVVGSFFIDETT